MKISGGVFRSGVDNSCNHSQRIDGRIISDSDEGADTDEEGDENELFDSTAMVTLIKIIASASSDSGSITITSQRDPSFSLIDPPAGLGSTNQPLRPTPQQNLSNLFTPFLILQGGKLAKSLILILQRELFMILILLKHFPMC